MFAIENTRTRNSLRTVFEGIFQKYGRDFDEDDEVDLLSLKVVKAGGHLARIKPLAFGRAFRGKGPQQSADDAPGWLPTDPLDEDEDDLGEDVFEFGGRVRAQANRVAHIQSSFNQAVASRRAKDDDSHQAWPKDGDALPASRKRPRTFHAALLRILREEQRQTRQDTRRQCGRPDCFDCVLLTQALLPPSDRR